MIKILYDSLTKKYFQFSGRANRREYWIVFLSGIFLFWVISLLSLYYYNLIVNLIIINPYLAWPTACLILFLVFGAMPPFVTITVRRLHDFNFNGWWFLIISLFDIWTNDFFNNITGGFIIANIPHFILGIVKGTPAANKYGEPPTE